MRLASPGDDGDLTQTIAAQAAATVTEVAAAVQQAAQVVPPPPVPVPAAPSNAVEAFTGAPTVLEAQIDDEPAVPAESLGADDAPRRGGQALLASWHLGRAAAAQKRSGNSQNGWSVRGIQALRSSEPVRTLRSCSSH